MCIDKGVFKTKIYSSIFAVVLMIAICHSLNAQNQISYNGNIINSIHSIDKALDNNAFDHLISNNSILIGASFSNPLSAKNIQTLKRKGVYLLEYLGNHSYIVGVDKSNPLSELKDLGINHIFEIPVASKIDDEISNSSKDILTLSLHIPVSFQEEAISSLAAMGIQGKAIIAQEFHVIKIKTNKSKVEELAQLPFVLFIGLEQEFYALMDYNNNINGIGSSNTQSANSFGLTGAGVVVGISDVGPVQEQHIDHQDRIIVDNTSGGLHSVSFHGNHVLGTVGGSGIMDEKYSGIAPASELIFSPINTLHNTYYIDNNNMVLSNHSYGAVTVNGSEYGGKYTSHPTLTDMRILENDQVLEIWSAGNSDAGFQTLANGYNVAKNVLTVSGAGMSQTSGLFRPETVSMGPTLDGRIKPEVCANVSNYSTNAENGYRFASGTSMSAPTATGAVALMYEHYRNTNNGNDPKSATLKALLCNTADDYGNVGPDFKWGFGNLNLNKALKALDNTQYSESNIGQSETNSGFLVVPANVKQLKVLLYWHDKNGAPNCNTNCLVNDLDLEVTNTNGNTVLPLILDPSNPSAVATNGVDRINNIEQVIIDNPTPGNYDLKVSGFNLPFGNIDYTLVYEFVTEDMEITFPFEGEHLISDSKYYIIWEDYLGTSESYTIEYSTDGGSNWSTIESNYTIEAFKSRSYYWDLPSLNTDRLKIKISSNGREVETGNIIVSTRTKIEEISFDENNNLDISWEVVQGATSYNIYKYSQGDNQPILITNTNQTNTNINGLDPYFENYMIVEPVFSNGAGIKSTAVKALAPILYVDENANGNDDGSSWANAFTSLKKAVAKGGREIWIAEGTYTSYDPYLSLRATFNLEKGVHLIGGFPSPSSFPGGNPTKSDIDIENHPSIIDATSSYHQVFVMEDQTSLNGIQVINQTSVQNGGVVLIEANGQHDEKNITIENCKFENITGSNGAGIYAASSQNGRINLFLENNVFTNISGNLGSNLYFKSIGSGTSVNVEVNNCIFDNASSVNSSVYGFAKTSGKVDVKVQNTLFSNAQGTSFQVNSERSGRFIFDLVNTTIVNSTLANEEPVFKIESASNANTSAFNILNAILWDEQLFEHTNNGNSTINVVHSSLKSAVCPDGIICCANTMYNEDPMFEDETLSKYTLKEGSPAIDKGTDSVDVVYDINYEPRPQGINLDLGAYESEYTASGITLDIKLFLEGTYNPTLQKMNTDYYAQNYLSLSQPFHDTPRNYTGNEAVTNYTQFERLYNGTTLQVVSWVLVNLIDQNNINNIIEQKAGLLWDNGSVTDTEHQPIKILLTPDLYYVAVIAPGHLGVMTATPFDFNQTQQIDFTNPSFAAFGGNDAQIEMAGIMTFICGDVNGDGIINAADRSPVWTKRNTIGNTKEDINRDGICNAADRTKTWNNRNRFSYLPF